MKETVTIKGKPIIEIYESFDRSYWYVTERADEQDSVIDGKVYEDDQIFFGYVRLSACPERAEFGYFSEAELKLSGGKVWKVVKKDWAFCPEVEVCTADEGACDVGNDPAGQVCAGLRSCSNLCKGVGKQMDEEIKQQIRFILDDDNEVMQAALESDSYLDEDNRRMNRELIQMHEQILAKLDRGELLSQQDLQLIRDANEIHLNDVGNLNGHHKGAIVLDDWLDKMIKLSKQEAMRILEEWLDRDSNTPVRVYQALHTLWEEMTPNDVVRKAAFDDEGKCLKCSSKVSFADVTDTLVFVGDEIVKRYDGDITNRNCVRCTYPEQYPDYEDYDDDDGE